jgi:hypothetical protein
MKSLWAVLGGLLVAAVAIAAVHVPLERRKAELEGQLRQQEKTLEYLKPVRVQVDAYQVARRRLDEQVTWIKRERDRRECPWPLPGLGLEGIPGIRIDGVVVEGSTLVLLGTADSPEAVGLLANGVRAASWAQEVQAGAARPERSRFGLFARVKLPACGTGEPDGAKEATP